jgi:hypothetical protein
MGIDYRAGLGDDDIDVRPFRGSPLTLKIPGVFECDVFPHPVG